jgi:GNAT superfamily N-acetyltransferase
LLDDGYTELPPSKIAAVVTHLEMRQPPPQRPAPAGGLSLAPLGGDLARYRALYRKVGERWLWFSRLVMSDAELLAILENPAVEAFALSDGATDVGLLELDFREPDACELAFFGVVPDAIGTGAGRFLMNAAIERAFTRPIDRFWVHTCTLDHPSAVEFYVRSGFTPYKRAVEVADDPRLTGHLPREAAPHAPAIGAPSLQPAPRG